MLRHAPCLTFLLLTALVLPAAADQSGAASKTSALLEELARAADAKEAGRIAGELAKTSADSVDTLGRFLARPHKSSDADRRAVLVAIEADVPDEKGRFSTPQRKTAAQKKKEDEIDWLAELGRLPKGTPGLSEVVADVAVIRALAASRQPSAATVILDFAFDELGIIYRDECGRYLRRMAPYSLPTLIMASQLDRKDPSKDRYATYQLERLDRQNPNKAIDSASADLKVLILKAFADSQYREAVYTTLDHVDHIDPRVRAAARAAWLEYTTGRPPKQAPKRKLQMTGGKLSDEEEPLWLNHRELADIELRRRLEALTGTAPKARATLAEMNKELFDFYDARRGEKLEQSFAEGMQLAKQSKWAEAAELFDKILAQDPRFDQRAQMAETYFELGKHLQQQKQWHEASTAFAKAHAVAPEGKNAKEALASHHYSRGQMQRESSGGGSAELERAREIDPEHGGASHGGGGGNRKWMLYGGIVWFVAGGLLLALGLRQRRRRKA